MVSGKKADFLGTPQFTGVTIPPPTATEGFKAEDIDTLGSEEEGYGDFEGEGEGGEAMGNSFGIMLIVIIVGAIILFALKMAQGL